MLPVMERVLGWYLLLGAASGFAGIGAILPSRIVILFPVFAVPLLLWGAAGICVLRRVRTGRLIGMFALAFQLLSFSAGVVDYHFSPIYSFTLGWISSDVNLGFRLGPEMHLRIGKAVPFRLAIDLVALYGMIILWRSMRKSVLTFRAARDVAD